MITIYHNGRCSKSRGALEILQEENIPHEVRWYLTEPLSAMELKILLKKLGMKAEELLRKNETFYKENLKGKVLSDAAIIKEMVDHPELIERPIVENGDKAVVARPAERLHEVL